MTFDNRYTALDRAADIINLPLPEVPGFCLSLLKKHYYYSALYTYAHDDSVKPWLYRQLTLYAHSAADRNNWPKKVRAKIDIMVMLALQELRFARSITEGIKLSVLEVPRSTFYRTWAKPYNDIYSVVLGWSHSGAISVLRKLR